MKYLFSLMLGMLFLMPQALAKDTERLDFLTEEYPPFNFTDQQRDVQGFSRDILYAIWQTIGVKPAKIRVMPWDRGYYLALQKPRTVLFSMTRIESRESLFKWVCPIAFMRVVLMGKQDTPAQLNSISEANKYRIAAVRTDVGEQLLFEQRVSDDQIVLFNQLAKGIEALDKGEVDLLSGGEIIILNKFKELGIDPAGYEVKWTLESNPLCFAFNRSISDQTVRMYQKALNSIQGNRKLIHKLHQRHGMLLN